MGPYNLGFRVAIKEHKLSYHNGYLVNSGVSPI